MALAKRSYQGKAEKVITLTLDDLHAEILRLQGVITDLSQRPVSLSSQGLTQSDVLSILQQYGVPLIGQTADDQLTNIGTGNGTVTIVATSSSASGFSLSGGPITTSGTITFSVSNAGNARTTLGLGTISTQNSNSVTITGGSITGITDIAVADGGTGASTAANAKANLGIPKNNSAASAPTVNDDSSAGYSVHSLWLDTSGPAEYVLLDATVGAANWSRFA